MVNGKAEVTVSLCTSSLFWDVTQRSLAVSYRRFGTTYRYHSQVSSSTRVRVIQGFLNLGVGWNACTSLPSHHFKHRAAICVCMRCVTISILRRLIDPLLCCTSKHVWKWLLYTAFLYDIYCLLYMGWTVRGLILSRAKRLLSSPKRLHRLRGLSILLFPCRKGREVVQPLSPSSVEVK